MIARSWQRCDACEHLLDIDAAETSCPRCAGLLSVEHTAPEIGGAELRREFDARVRAGTRGRAASGVWRFHELVHPVAMEDAVSHPEGNTPLLEAPPLAAWAGIEGLLLKHEGHNPTGSFKDRGMSVAITQARRIGATAVACASTGNTSASLAAYAAIAGLRALTFVPEGQVAMGKLAQTLGYGARTLLVAGDFDRCLALVREVSRELGVYLVNSVNPFRIEGQQTIVFELLQQLAWDPPDWIVLPAGNLGNVAAFGRAIERAHATGLIARPPRLAAIQAAGAAPFAASFARDFDRLEPVHAETLATAIRIGAPASYPRAVHAIRSTHGQVRAVTDEEILEAKVAIDRAGIGCEPGSAAALAGARALRQAGIIRSSERVTVVLTGHLLKDPGILRELHELGTLAPKLANRPIRISPSVAEVRRILDAAE